MDPTQLTLNAQLTTFVAGVYPPEFIGRTLAPMAPAQIIADLAFNWWKFDPAEYLRVVDLKINRRGNIPVADFAFKTDTAVLSDYGRRLIHPNDVARLTQTQPSGVLQVPIDTRMAKAKALVDTFWFSHEIETNTLFTTLANYKTGNAVDASAQGNSGYKLDDPDTDVVAVIQTAMAKSLIKPDTAWMGLAVWLPLRRHPKIISAIKAVLGDRQAVEGVANEAEVAKLFDLRQVVVGEQRGNFAAPGEAASYQRVWGKDFGLCRVEPAPLSTVAPYAGTALTAYGALFGSAPVFVQSSAILPGQEHGGLWGAVQDIVGHCRRVIMTNQDSCFLIKNAVTNDV